jgi:putative ABC transport system permease protein
VTRDGESLARFATRYAFRNLWRNRRRTFLTMSTVLFSVAVGIIANRYSTAVMRLWQDGAADTGTAHAQIHAAGYWQRQDGLQASLTLPEGGEIERAVRGDPSVATSVRRLRLEGIVSTGDESVYFIGKGVEPAAEAAASPKLFTKNDEGSFVTDADKYGVTIGKGLAESLRLKIGDELTLIAQTAQGSVNGIDAHVIGIVDAEIPSFSKRVVYTHIELLQRLVRLPGRYTELGVKLAPGVDVDAWVEGLRPRATAAGAELRGWWEIEPVIRNVGRIWDSVVILITGLLLLSTALSVLNIVFMVVAERTVEIGTLMALGARARDVRVLFALEATLIGLVGGGLGALAGNAVVYAMDYAGVPFQSPFGAGQLIIHPKMHLAVSLAVYGSAVAICALAALAPARKASRVEPVAAFRGQIS